MINYIIVDTANMFFRAKHVVRGDSLDTKIGMCWHIMFSSINKAWKQFHGNHVVFCLEGRSWRRSVYDPYKRNRDAVREALTPKEQEEDEEEFRLRPGPAAGEAAPRRPPSCHSAA